MRRHWTLVVGVALGLVWSSTVYSDSCCRGFYVSGEAVYSWTTAGDLTSTGTTTGPLIDDEFFDDSVGGGGLALGYDFSYHFGANIRIEGEFIHIVRVDLEPERPMFSDGTLPGAGIENNGTIRTLMLNVFYDWDLGTWYTPHVGFGIGYARNHSDANLIDFDTGRRDFLTTTVDNLAWSLMAGVQLDMSDNWFADLGYRYIDTGELAIGQFPNGVKLESDDVTRHDLMIGIGYRF